MSAPVPDFPVTRRVLIRVAFLLLLLFSIGLLAQSYLDYQRDTAVTIKQQAQLDYSDRRPIVAPRDNITVVATQNTGVVTGALVAFAPDGRLLYYNATYDNYHDIDPARAGRRSVSYLASVRFDNASCGIEGACAMSVVERVNLTTGQTERQYTYYRPAIKGSAAWHDVDWINDTHLAVADIALDRVFIVNTSSGIVSWSWPAQSDYSISSGGSFPDDWTHLNDVEYLDNGRLMASIRNQDEVVFLTQSRGIQPNWTLGQDDNHTILFEQHNPDYIPSENGGPAVIVADSENNRVVEYHRTNGTWTRTWSWQDEQLQWPRDADRLPNGHTLITDSNGHRVLEVDEAGDVVWTAAFNLKVYEAERLGTGAESTGGPSARAAGLDSKRIREQSSTGSSSISARVFGVIKGIVPFPILNAVLFFLPPWVHLGDLLPIMILAVTPLFWGAVELWWASIRVRVRSPIVIEQEPD